MAELVFDEAEHKYSLGGEELIAVSDILKEAGIVETRFFTKEGSDNGKRRHKICELYSLGTLDWGSVEPVDLPYLDGCIKFLEERRVEVQYTEKMSYHRKYRYAGTADLLCAIDGAPWVIDYKTGKPARWHNLQLILYGLMFTAEGQKPNLGCVYLNDKGTYKFKEYDYADEVYALSALNVAKWKRR